MSNLANNENEELALIHVAGFMLPALLGAAVTWLSAQSAKLAVWLVGHKVMVAPAETLVPITEHAGLDLVRLIAAVAIVCTIGFAVVRLSPRKKCSAR